ncbi:hypothetical protein IKF92_01415 [Candidatus Saccharibacteria bacterium]|nr:hypothetical protein [Candidatus Saccharibacteria bacterium]
MVKKPQKRIVHSNYRPQKITAAPLAKKITLGVIFAATLTIIIATILSLILTPENVVKSTISDIVSDYYENYFYQKLESSPNFSKENPGLILEKYQTTGLSTLTLRDLLIYDNQKHYDKHDYLAKYCDEDHTFIRIFPEPPYEKKSYHTDITYSCNF